MRAFVIWSGAQSEKIGLALHRLIGNVLPGVECFISHEVPAGGLWERILVDRLHKANFAIVCMTYCNRDNVWMHFEAGAVSKIAEEATVIPYLIGDLGADDLEGPLNRFKALSADRDGTLDLLLLMNRKMPARLQDKDEAVARRFAESTEFLAVLDGASGELEEADLRRRLAALEDEVSALRTRVDAASE